MYEKKLKTIKNDEDRWNMLALLYEDEQSMGNIIDNSNILNQIETRKILGHGKKSLVSIRIPLEDLIALKAIGKKFDKIYQQLAIKAIEKFLDEYYLYFMKEK